MVFKGDDIMSFDLNIREKALFENLDLKSPLSVQIEVCETCNLKCQFCYNNSNGNTTNIWNDKKKIDYIKHLISKSDAFCYIISGGEPLIYKNEVLQLLQLINKYDASSVLLTNGYYLDEEFALKIRDLSWYWVQVSLDSSNQIVHNDIRGKQDSYQRAINAIKILRKYKIPVVISTVVLPNTLNDMENIIKLAIELKVNGVLFSEAFPIGRAISNQRKCTLDANRRQVYLENIKKCKEKYDDKLMIKSAQFYENQLSNIHNPMGYLIRPNGDVKIDCLSSTVIENISHYDCDEIWRLVRNKEKV